MGAPQTVTPESPATWMAMAWFSFGVMLTGALFAPWPWWLTGMQGVVAAGCFVLGVDADPQLSSEASVCD